MCEKDQKSPETVKTEIKATVSPERTTNGAGPHTAPLSTTKTKEQTPIVSSGKA